MKIPRKSSLLFVDFLGDPKSQRFMDVIKYSNHPFKNIEEMDKEMIKRWNNKVGKEDTVLHLGDFGIEEGFLDLISSSAKEDDEAFLIKSIDNLLAKKKSKYFEEYRKPELEDLKGELKEGKDATTTEPN